MSFADLQSTSAAQVVRSLGEQVTYTASGGSAETIWAIVDYEVSVTDVYGTGIGELRDEIEFDESDVPNIARGDAVTVDSVVYTIQDRLEADSDMCRWSMLRV